VVSRKELQQIRQVSLMRLGWPYQCNVAPMECSGGGRNITRVCQVNPQESRGIEVQPINGAPTFQTQPHNTRTMPADPRLNRRCESLRDGVERGWV
jgi:hypothetical protein